MELNINAAITSPAHDESVPLTQEPYTVKGYAYSGMPPACLQRCLGLLWDLNFLTALNVECLKEPVLHCITSCWMLGGTRVALSQHS